MAKQADGVRVVALSSLRPNPLNPRTIREDDSEIAELAASIKANGLLQPLLVTPDGLIVCGHRRAIACRKAGLKAVPAFQRHLDETQQLEAMLAENVARENLNPSQIAKACRDLSDRGRSPEGIGRTIGMGKQTVERHLALLTLPATLQRAVADYRLPLGAVPHLVRLKSSRLQLEIGQQAIKEEWLLAEVAAAVSAALRPPASSPKPVASIASRTRSETASRPTVQERRKPTSSASEIRGLVDLRIRVASIVGEAASIIDEHPEFVTDSQIESSVKRLADAIRRAQRRAA